MNKEQFDKLKKEQRPYVEKFNRASSKATKKKLYQIIMEYEERLMNEK